MAMGHLLFKLRGGSQLISRGRHELNWLTCQEAGLCTKSDHSLHARCLWAYSYYTLTIFTMQGPPCGCGLTAR